MSLTLLVTSYNSKQHLDRFFCWMRLVNHFFSEVIIIDDCSSDDSFLKILEEAKLYPNFITNRRATNSGRPSLPRNEGVQMVSSERLMFLDIDDLVPVKYVAHIAQSTSQHCYSGMKSAVQERDYNSDYNSDLSQARTIEKRRIKYKNLVTFSGASIPTNIAQKYSFVNEPLEDWDFWMQIAENEIKLNFIKFIDVPIYYDQGESLSPIKTKQVARVLSKIGYLKMPIYFFETLRLRFYERRSAGRLAKSMSES
jgi:glycosyltransferase involved in cell wall biosynthesis